MRMMNVHIHAYVPTAEDAKVITEMMNEDFAEYAHVKRDGVDIDIRATVTEIKCTELTCKASAYVRAVREMSIEVIDLGKETIE